MGSADLWKDVEQLQLLVRRVEVEQRDDEDDRRILPPTILPRTLVHNTLRVDVWYRRRYLPECTGSTEFRG